MTGAEILSFYFFQLGTKITRYNLPKETFIRTKKNKKYTGRSSQFYNKKGEVQNPLSVFFTFHIFILVGIYVLDGLHLVLLNIQFYVLKEHPVYMLPYLNMCVYLPLKISSCGKVIFVFKNCRWFCLCFNPEKALGEELF